MEKPDVGDVLARLHDYHIDILKHDIDWGQLILDAINIIHELIGEPTYD